MSDIALLTANFNYDELTFHMVDSFRKVTRVDIPIYCVDNSNAKAIDAKKARDYGINIIDNTMYSHTPFTTDPSTNHCQSIEYALSLLPADYCILVDNDVIFKPKMKEFVGKIGEFMSSYDCVGEIGHDVLPKDRIFPYLCLFNLKKMRVDNIHYYREFSIIRGIADTGASFYDDIRNRGWRIAQIRLNDYIIHLKNGSFGKRNIQSFLNLY